MPLIPEKLTKYPFVTWGFAVATLVIIVWLFGPENVWALITSQVEKAAK